MKILENYKNQVVDETVDISGQSYVQNPPITQSQRQIVPDTMDGKSSSSSLSLRGLQNQGEVTVDTSQKLTNKIQQSSNEGDVTSQRMEDIDEQLNQRSSQISIPRGILSNKLHENQREITQAFPANGLNSKLSNIEIDDTCQQIGVFEQKQMEKEMRTKQFSTGKVVKRKSLEEDIDHANISLTDLLNCSETESYSLSHSVICPSIGQTPTESNDVPFTSTQLSRVSPLNNGTRAEHLDLSSVLEEKHADTNNTNNSNNLITDVIKNRNNRTKKHLVSKSERIEETGCDFLDNIDMEINNKARLVYVKDKVEPNSKRKKGKELVAKLKSKMSAVEKKRGSLELSHSDSEDQSENKHKSKEDNCLEETVKNSNQDKLSSSTLSKLKLFVFDNSNSSLARRDREPESELKIQSSSNRNTTLNSDQKNCRKINDEDSRLSESMISGHLWTDGNSGTISQVNGTNIDNSTKVKRACDLLNLVRNNQKSRTNCQLSQDIPSNSQSSVLSVSKQTMNIHQCGRSQIVPQSSQSPSWLTSLSSKKSTTSTPVFNVTDDDFNDLDLDLDIDHNATKRQKVS
jgi:hypothetical protein